MIFKLQNSQKGFWRATLLMTTLQAAAALQLAYAANRLAPKASQVRKWGVTDAVSGLLAYEHFDYPLGSGLSGRDGGMGWSNGWVDVSGDAGESVMSGLAAGDNVPAGFDAPSNYWVMAVYDATGGNGVSFYSTPGFRHWTFHSKIYIGFFDCPDMFQLPVDGDTIEIFGNNGQLYMPLRANNPVSTSLISLTCTSGDATFDSLTVNKLKSIWTRVNQ